MTWQNDAWLRTWDQVSYLPYTTQLVLKLVCGKSNTEMWNIFVWFHITVSSIPDKTKQIFNGSLESRCQVAHNLRRPAQAAPLKKRQLEIVLIKEFRRGNVASRHTESPRCVRGGVRVSTFHPGQICLLRWHSLGLKHSDPRPINMDQTVCGDSNRHNGWVTAITYQISSR